jgi:hypothetical protein
VQVLSSVLVWNFALTSQLNKLPYKMQRDFVPTLINGRLQQTFILLLSAVHAQQQI